MEDCSILGKWGKPALCLALALVLAILGGCTRRFYRERADKEVAAILVEKDKYPQWKLENYHVYPHPRARFADPSDPDHPPMPPDDPAAADLAPQPQRPGKAGVVGIEGTGYLDLLRAWDAQNRGENPGVTPCAGDGTLQRPFLITLDQAAELGLINSREFQTRRENLYLTALPVTLERFGFAAQFFALETALRERAGKDTVVGERNRWQALSQGGFTKLFSTGALLLARFANDTVVNLTGPNRHTLSVSTLNLDFVQPFLRGGGKAVTLEPLTQVERNLVYEIRNYARFRKQFYTFVAAGFDLPAFTTIFGRLGGAAFIPGAVTAASANVSGPLLAPGGAGRVDLSFLGLAPSEGYLPNLLRAAILANERKNVVSLEAFLKRFEYFERAGRIPPLQVSQVRSQLLQGQSTVLQRQQELRDGLDRFKIQLGLPVNLPLVLEPAALRPIQQHFQRYENVFSQFTAALEDLKKVGSLEKGTGIRAELRRLFVEAPIVQGTAFRETFLPRWDQWAPEKVNDQVLRKGLESLRKQQAQLLELKQKREDEKKSLTPQEEQLLQQLDSQIETGELELAVRRYEREPWKNLPEEAALSVAAAVMVAAGEPRAGLLVSALREYLRAPGIEKVRAEIERRRKQVHGDAFQQLADAFEQVLIEARGQRFEPLGKTWPAMPPVELGGRDLLAGDLDERLQAVAQTALTERLDLMNVRGTVNDAWRQLRVFANSLLGAFDVAYHLDSTTPHNEAKPLAFTGSRTRHQLIFNAELPLVRVVERNNYRASLIAYQRERRNLMASEDQIANTVRAELRALRVLAQNYRIQQQAVELAYQQVENSLATLEAPPEPGSKQDTATQAAALTNQLLQSQSGLVRAQNQLYTFWINFLLTRIQLYLDLELMPLDPRGVWIDELATRQRSPAANGTDGTGQPASGPPGGEREGQRDGAVERGPLPRPLTPAAAAPLE